MQKRTYTKTITKEGAERKLFRLIAKELYVSYPQIYSELEQLASAIINADDHDPRSTVSTFGIGAVKYPSAKLKAAVKEQREFTKETIRKMMK